jgi:predicted dehydrogenase
MTAPPPIGVGIIGLSASRGWAGTAHVPALRALSGLELRAVSASSRASAAAAAEAHGVPLAVAGHQELVEHPDVDLVVVAVRVPLHHELVSAALNAGKHVLCEWPLGNGLAEARALEQLAQTRQVRGYVGLQARAAPAVRYIRDIIASGAIGDVLSTTLVGSGDAWGATVHPSAVYLTDRANGATMLSIPVGHALDALAFCLGEVVEVSATTAVRRPTVRRSDSGVPVPMTSEDQVAVTGRLAGGAVLSLHYRGGRSPATNLRWEIDGTRGAVVVEGRSGHLQYGDVEVRAALDGAKRLTAHPVPARYQDVALVPGTPAYAVGHAYAHLLGDLRADSGQAATFADAVLRHRTLHAIERAAVTGARRRP